MRLGGITRQQKSGNEARGGLPDSRSLGTRLGERITRQQKSGNEARGKDYQTAEVWERG